MTGSNTQHRGLPITNSTMHSHKRAWEGQGRGTPSNASCSGQFHAYASSVSSGPERPPHKPRQRMTSPFTCPYRTDSRTARRYLNKGLEDGPLSPRCHHSPRAHRRESLLGSRAAQLHRLAWPSPRSPVSLEGGDPADETGSRQGISLHWPVSE